MHEQSDTVHAFLKTDCSHYSAETGSRIGTRIRRGPVGADRVERGIKPARCRVIGERAGLRPAPTPHRPAIFPGANVGRSTTNVAWIEAYSFRVQQVNYLMAGAFRRQKTPYVVRLTSD